MSLTALLVPKTRAEALDSLLAIMQSLGLPTTAWQEGNPLRTAAEAVADVYADATEAVASIAAGGFLGLAAGQWLTLLSQYNYSVERKVATRATIKAALTAASGAGPHVIAAGDLWISDSAGKRFTNTTGGTLTLGPSTLELEWQAETAGTSHNVADSTVTVMVTNLAGVTVNNPGPTSIQTAGSDEEADAQLSERCALQWGTLGIPTAEGLKAFALEASDEVTRAWVDDQNPGGPGTAYVYLASATGPATAQAVTDVQAYLDDGRTPVSATYTASAAVQAIVPVTATVYAKATAGLTSTDCEDAVTAYFKSLDIGGDDIPALAPANLFRDQIEKAILNLDGALTVDLTAPAADVALASFEVAVPSFSISVVGV